MRGNYAPNPNPRTTPNMRDQKITYGHDILGLAATRPGMPSKQRLGWAVSPTLAGASFAPAAA